MPTVMLTGMDADTLERIKDSAATRALTAAEYVARLVRLHEAVRRAAASGNSAAAELLAASDLH
jgi:hypothetical protein